MLRKSHIAAMISAYSIVAFSLVFGDDTSAQTLNHMHQTDKTATTESTSASEQEEMTKVSEAFGHFIGRNLNAPGIKFDLDSIIKGMREGAAGKPAPMSDQEYEKIMTKLQEKAFSQVSAENLKEANQFMSDNAKKDKVVVIEPGMLQYTILQEGTGATVTEHSHPLINYSGKYADGTVFGSSEQVGGPITVPLDQTIPGFSKGIVGMKEGEKRLLFVHPDLGYGTTGQLPPNKLLIFEIQVVKADNAAEKKGAMLEGDDLLPMAICDDDSDMSDEG